MRILSIEKAGKNLLIWYDDGINYVDAIVTDDNRIDINTSVPIAKYPAGIYQGDRLSGYEFFAACMGKFNPHTVFLLEPIEIDKLDFMKLLDILEKIERR